MPHSPNPLVAAPVLSFVSRAMVRAGVPEAPVSAHLAALGVSTERPSGRVAWASYRALWSLAAREHPAPAEDLGIRVAGAIPFGARDLTDFVLRSASTLGEVARLTVELAPLFDESLIASAEDLGASMLLRAGRAPGLSVPDAMSDYGIARTLSTLRQLMGARLEPERVFLTRSRPRQGDAHRAFYGCPVCFEHAFDGLQVPRAWGDRPLPGSDEALHRTLLEHTRRALEEVEEAQGAQASLTEQVSRVLAELIGAGGQVQQDSLARRLAQSPRSLRRGLAAEGTSYAELHDQARLEYAQAALRDGRSIESVAAHLGFASPASFTRAFRRWVGVPPDTWRRGELADSG